MPAFLNWLLRLVPTNPICLRLVQGGSRRRRHLFIRSGYLAVMIFMLMFALLGTVAGSPSVRDLARAGAQTFTWISYLQVGLICLLTPVFMAGAIAQEANPRTWDIVLTTPLGNVQIVLGNLFGRLFFILALLFSTLPLFAVTQYFGGVPGKSIFASYAIAASSSLVVAAIAITLCVNRTAGRRAVFWFYAAVVTYLFLTYAADAAWLRQPIAAAATQKLTTVMTPLNPFLALEVLLRSNAYTPHDLTGTGAAWLTQMWLSRPIAAFCWLCVAVSLVLIAYSTLRVRLIGSRTGMVPWHRRLLGLGAKGAVERPARHVGHNPIAWRESVARGKTMVAIAGRWGFVVLGIGVGLVLIGVYHTGAWTAGDLRAAVLSVLAAEVVVIALVAINSSATAVSREREDGTLDLILTTPIQPGPGRAGGVSVSDSLGTGTITLPVVLPEGAIALPLALGPFVAFCVMVGLHWSIKSKGTIGSVVAAVLVVSAVAGVIGVCGIPAGQNMPIVGALITSLSPVNLLWAIVLPASTVPKSLLNDPASCRVALVIGAVGAGAGYAMVVYALHTTMKRSFMMTVRRLAGTT
jgi:ABC-type transport system involved in multi-copper enzyme maturation permease subunit